ncbi:MAG: HAD family phosphatase [Phycisphaerae bacterium]|nr:HAD family phosphatase [Phycisphaerae bacterium]
MHYQLLALDVDGTLIGADGAVSSQTKQAIRAACDAGMRVCLATGRSYVETMPVWRQIDWPDTPEPLVLVGGALVSEAHTGRTLYHLPMDRDLAAEFGDALGEAGHAAMAFVDRWRHGVDYYLAECGAVHVAFERWFAKMDVTIRRVPRLADAPDLPAPLRVSTVVDVDRAADLADRLRQRFDGRLRVHAILAPNYEETIVEAFSPHASKFEALRYVAQAYEIGPGRIVAVGDDVNDVEMVAGAGLGVAMPKASPPLRDAADVTASPTLAAFIHDMLDGAYDNMADDRRKRDDGRNASRKDAP